MSSAGEAAVVAVVTGGVLQTEAGLVALGHHVVGVGVQQVVVAELVHAVEVSADQSSRRQSEEGPGPSAPSPRRETFQTLHG